MTEWSDELINDIVNVRNKVKEARLNLTGGVVENKANEVGKSVAEFSKHTYEKLEQLLSDIDNGLSSGGYKFSDKVKHETGEFSKIIKKIHYDVRNSRREITGGYIEDETNETLKAAEEKLGELIDKMNE